MIEIMVLPSAVIEGKNVPSDTLVISIVSPYVQHPMIHGEHVYKFAFYDVTEEYLVDDRLIQPMAYEIAESIVEICMNHRDKKRWIIHCEAGISRSPGVAIGLARYIDLNLNVEKLWKMFPHHNKYVRKNIETAMQRKLDEIEENLKTMLSPGPVPDRLDKSCIDPHGF